MTSIERRSRRIAAGDFAGVLLLLAPSSFLGLFSALGPRLGVLIPLSGVVLGSLLRAALSHRLRFWSALPVLVGVGGVSITARISPLTDILAGLCGIALLVWWANESKTTPGSPFSLAGALTLPSLAVALALGSSLLLPPSDELVGVAAGLLVGILVYVAWLFENPRGFAIDEPSGS